MRIKRMMTGAAVILSIVLSVGWPAVAQSSTLGLSAGDFALLQAANKTPVKSFAFQYTVKVAVKGLETFAIDADMKGAGAVDRTAHVLDLSLSGPVQLGTAQT